MFPLGGGAEGDTLESIRQVGILLIKPETVGIFCYTNPVEHEPLETEYLKTILEQNGYDTLIYDRRYDLTSLRRKLKAYRPEIVCITGYMSVRQFTREYYKLSLAIAWNKRHCELYSEISFLNATLHIVKTWLIKLKRLIMF